MGILKLENVGYRYKDAPKDSYVFKDINYEFEQGKIDRKSTRLNSSH